MILQQRLAAVIPAFNEACQLRRVLSTLPPCVDFAVVVDDSSTDATADVAASFEGPIPVHLVRHASNRGVGAAIESGYRRAIEAGAHLMVVLAGDGQMGPDDVERVALPVANGRVDYAKGNRLANLREWREIPKTRLLGNLGLSLATQVASGLWGCWDSQSGFTVISRRAAAELLKLGIYPRFGCPNDILVKLGALGFKVENVRTRPVYGVGERSKLKVRRVLFTIPGILARGWVWRMRYQYLRRGKSGVRVGRQSAQEPEG